MIVDTDILQRYTFLDALLLSMVEFQLNQTLVIFKNALHLGKLLLVVDLKPINKTEQINNDPEANKQNCR